MTLTDAFKYNQHFVAMMNIINMSRLNPPESGHKHHIIPKCWFKMNNLPIDNSKDNLVLLSYEDHCKVHKLMSMCSITEELRHKMICAYNMLMKGTVLGISYKHTQDTKNKMSEAHKGKHFSKETLNKMSEAHKCKNLSDETRRKMSEAAKCNTKAREKARQSRLGTHHTEEAKKRISKKVSAFQKGRKRGPYKKKNNK